MAYKISDTAMIIESDGKAILIADEAFYKGTLSIGSTVNDLPSDYFTDYFLNQILIEVLHSDTLTEVVLVLQIKIQ